MKQVLEKLQQAAAELARGVNVIYDKEFTKMARSIYRGLEANGYYNIKED